MKKSKVFIFGGGFMGRLIESGIKNHFDRSDLPYEAVLIDVKISKAMDIRHAMEFARAVHGEPFAIFNAIGKTGVPNVDWCEDHKEETFFGNVEVPLLLAEAAWKDNLTFMHISSGCIFNGKGPFRADSIPNFEGSYYSYTKLQAEKRLQDLAATFPNAKLEMHRIRMPVTTDKSPRNLISKLIAYDTVVSTDNSITYVPDYIDFVVRQLTRIHNNLSCRNVRNSNFINIYNATNPGSITHKEIIEMISEVTGKTFNKTYITPDELNGIVKIPRTNCVLEANGIDRPIKQAIHDAIVAWNTV